jgi:hypothetical protein
MRATASVVAPFMIVASVGRLTPTTLLDAF